MAVAIFAWLARARWTGGQTTISKLPIPLGAEWIWGHERQMFMEQPGRAVRRWVTTCGLTFRIKAAFLAPDILVLNDPGGISHILQKKIYDYHHSQVVRPRVDRLLGKGLGWVEGEDEHKRMKKLIVPSLSAETVRTIAPDLREAASRVINDLAHSLEGEEKESEVNILHWVAKGALNMIGRAAFMYDFDGGDSDDARRILNDRRTGASGIGQYAGFLALMLCRRFAILNYLPIPVIQNQSIVKDTIQSGVAREMIRNNEDLLKGGHREDRTDLLSRLLIAEAEGIISKEEVYDQISTFIISGHETTSQTLAFAVLELARHPDAQRRLREEINQLQREPCYDDYLSRLPYLDAVLRETLRLYPALAYMERVATKDDIIPLRQPIILPGGVNLNEVEVKAGQTVLIPIIAIHRLDSIWKDADTFRPERWFEKLPLSELLCSGWSNSLAFSDGPRSCIGLRLAIFEFKLLLTMLVTRFQFADAGVEIGLKVSSSLQGWVTGKPEEGPQIPVMIGLI